MDAFGYPSSGMPATIRRIDKLESVTAAIMNPCSLARQTNALTPALLFMFGARAAVPKSGYEVLMRTIPCFLSESYTVPWVCCGAAEA